MELLETQDPIKKKLIETSDRHKRELQKEVKEITDKSQRVLKNALIVGGTLALGYLVISQISSSRKKKKTLKERPQSEPAALEFVKESHTPSLLSKIGTQVLSQASLILLELAKGKLVEYLQSRREKDQPADQ